MKYIIETWNQPHGAGAGWAPCHGNESGARWFVWSTAKRVRFDKLNGRDFASRAEAEAAIIDAKILEVA